MDPRRAKTERNMLPTVGASFYREGDDVLFVFVIDPGNIMGPRPATRADQEKHAGAWAAFCAADGVSALDRDGSGEDGGSLPSESPVVVAVQEPEAEREVGVGRIPSPELPRQKRKYTRRKG